MPVKFTRCYHDNLRYIAPYDNTHPPTRDFCVMLHDGTLAESDDPAYIMDATTEYGFADCRDYPTQLFLLAKRLQTAALSLVMQDVWAQVYDGIGLLFENLTQEDQENRMDEPIILDAFDAQTTVMSLIRAGEIRFFEKVPWLTGQPHQGCDGCAFNRDGICQEWWNSESKYLKGTGYEKACPYATQDTRFDHYVEVTPDNMLDPSKNKINWLPISERKEELLGARQSLTDH